MVLLLAADVLVTYKVHTVTGARDQTDIRYGVECDQLLKVDRLVQEMDGLELDSAVHAVDATHKLVDNCPQILVLLHILARGDSHLDQNYLADPFRILRQEDLKSMQFLWDTLDIVESIHADNQLNALEFFPQGLDSIDD